MLMFQVSDSSFLVSLFVILAFFIINSFLIGNISKKYMNTINSSMRFMIGAMFLSITLLSFESILGLFGINYEVFIMDINGNKTISNGLVTFIIIQSIFLILYLINWKSLKVNFNFNWWKIFSWITIFGFLIGLYYGIFIHKIGDQTLQKGSSFFESIRMITSFTNSQLIGENPQFNNFILKHGLYVILLFLAATSINSFSNYGKNSFYIIFKKIGLSFFFISLFIILENMTDAINFLFLFTYLITLFGFFWNDSEIIVNNHDQNIILILTILSILFFNYWFLYFSIILAILFIIYSFSKRKINAILESLKIFGFTLMAMSFGFSSFRASINNVNQTIFILKIIITILLLLSFIIFYIIYIFLKKNSKYQEINFKIESDFSKHVNITLIGLLSVSYIIISTLMIAKVIKVNLSGGPIEILDSIFSFFNLGLNGIPIFIFFLIFWSIPILIFISIFSYHKINLKYKKGFKNINKLSLKDLESNIIFISFIAIAFIFNPLCFPVIEIILEGNINKFFNLNNFDQNLQTLNFIWAVPLLVTLTRLNEKGITNTKGIKYLISSEIILNIIIWTFPIYIVIWR